MLAVPAMQLIAYFSLSAHAGEEILSAADNSLILTSSALVLLMTPGLAFFYGGFTQAKNVLNTNHEFLHDGYWYDCMVNIRI